MRFTQSTQGIDAVNGGIGSIFKALAMAPIVRQQEEDNAVLRGAQTYSANMAGNKYGSEAAGNQYTLDMRKGIPERLVADPTLTAGVRRAYEAFQLGGPQYVDQVMKGFGEGQTQDIRQLAVDNVGNVDTMNRYNTLAKPGQTYEPFRADGGTGRAINQATGAGDIFDATLAKIYDDYKVAQTGHERAQTANSYASAGQHRASTEKLNAERQVIEAGGTVGGHGKHGKQEPAPVIIGYDQQGNPITDKPDPKLTELQGKATLFASRMRDASVILNDRQNKVSPMETALSGTSVGNLISSPDAQTFRQAQENWVTANLRLESGAAIPEKEMEQEIRKWFPRVGDTPEVIKQKAAARKVAEEGMATLSGPGQQLIARNLKNANSPASNGVPLTRKVVRRGVFNGRRVAQYEDGTVEYEK